MTEEEKKDLEEKKSKKLDDQMDEYWKQTGEIDQMRPKKKNSMK